MKRNEIQRAALDHDIANFLAAGGSITVVPFGESGEVIKPLRSMTQKEVRDIQKEQDALVAKDKGRVLL